ncbi:MAG: ABC transporter substrate-binding protein [Microcystaceae cyanobacterium]
MCLKPGVILNARYKILALLGRGGFGQTYKARDLHQSQHPICVVKEILPPQSPNPQILQEVEKRFKREAKTLARLGEHPQIPELIEFFTHNRKFYVIQEYIRGHDLTKEVGRDLPPLSEQQVTNLLKDVLMVLSFVHQQNMIHRDLKPSNLRRRTQDHKIVLIDFGAVKEFSSVAFSPGVTQAIGTPGYMAPEQQNGNPQLNSDLYSLGMMCLQALTGTHPRNLPNDPNTGDVIWRYATSNRDMVTVNTDLEHILNKMVHYHFSDRYYSAVEALADVEKLDIRSLSPERKPIVQYFVSRKPILLNFFKITGLSGLVVSGSLLLLWWWRPDTCPVVIGDNLSCGEEILIKTRSLAEKEAGIEAFTQGNYQAAADWLDKARQKDKKDPETLIYLNNIDLIRKKQRFYTIAVAVPLGNPSDGGDSGKEILRGVAQLQAKINTDESSKGKKLRVLIADDYNDAGRSREIADAIIKQPDILGVVGHYSSDSTRNALPSYQNHHLALISPTSTAQSLAEESAVFFRTVPRDEVNAAALALHLYQTNKRDKVAVFYNPNSPYSKSLHDEFRSNFYDQGGQVVKQFDLSKPIIDAEAAIAQSESQGATGLVLFPDAKVDPYAFYNALKVIRANRNRHLMVGGDSLYTTDLLQERQAVSSLVVSIPWHILGDEAQPFNQQSQKLWGEDVWEKDAITWRTAMAYDATKVLWDSLNQQPSLSLVEQIRNFLDPEIARKNLLATLGQPDFTTIGATGEIRFESSGDRKVPELHSVLQLVKILPFECSPYNYQFFPIRYSQDQVKQLKCDASAMSEK